MNSVMSRMNATRRTRVNESRHMCEWVMSHMKWDKSHMNSVMSRMNASRRTRTIESCHMCERVVSHMKWGMSLTNSVMSRMNASRRTRMNESCHTCEWVMSHVWMSHFTCEIRHVTYKLRHVAHECVKMNAYDWVMILHMRACHVTQTYEWVLSHTYECVAH